MKNDDVAVREWNDLDEVRLDAKLLRASNRLAKIPTSTVLEAAGRTANEVAVYKDFMADWPELEYLKLR